MTMAAWRGLTLASYAALLAALFYGSWTLGPGDVAARIVLWLLVSSGLLLVLPGLLLRWRRSFQWLCFILLLYFLFCVQAMFAGPKGQPTASWIEWWALLAIVIAFISAMLTARAMAQAQA